MKGSYLLVLIFVKACILYDLALDFMKQVTDFFVGDIEITVALIEGNIVLCPLHAAIIIKLLIFFLHPGLKCQHKVLRIHKLVIFSPSSLGRGELITKGAAVQS